MFNASTTLHDLLAGVTDNLPSTASPEDPSVLQALGLAVHAATATAIGPGADDWSSYAEAVQHAVRALHADTNNLRALTQDAPSAGSDGLELRQATTQLVKRLADLYATAAAGAMNSTHQRIIWSRVARYLDDAVAELT